MDAVLYINLVKGIAFFAGMVGLIAGIDLLFGVRLLKVAKGAVEKAVDFDRILVKAASRLRQRLDRKVGDLDEKIANPQVRIILGSLFIVLSAVILMLVRMY